jgi:uncharacterized cupin superfamily protein
VRWAKRSVPTQTRSDWNMVGTARGRLCPPYELGREQRLMPKIDLSALPARSGTTYPEPFAGIVDGREWQSLGATAGLSQFGVNLVRLKPGAASSARHWHEQEDEFVYMIEGELVLVEDEGETIVKPGDAAGFKAGVPNGHHLLNRTHAPVSRRRHARATRTLSLPRYRSCFRAGRRSLPNNA